MKVCPSGLARNLNPGLKGSLKLLPGLLSACAAMVGIGNEYGNKALKENDESVQHFLVHIENLGDTLNARGIRSEFIQGPNDIVFGYHPLADERAEHGHLEDRSQLEKSFFKVLRSFPFFVAHEPSLTRNKDSELDRILRDGETAAGLSRTKSVV